MGSLLAPLQDDVLLPPIIRAVSADSKQRVLALDVGNKRIGMAVSDELRVLARGLETLQRKSKRLDLEKIGEIVEKHGVCEIIVGHPIRMGGEASLQTEKVRVFAEELKRFGLPVKLWDERLTSVEAEAALGAKRSVKQHIQQRKSGAVDRMAAVLILQSYLDTKHSG